MPFKVRAILLPALVASNEKLLELGWRPECSASSILEHLYYREQGRVDSCKPQTGVSVITGAASGLGLAFAERLSDIRERLILIDVNESKLARVAAKFNNASYRVIDLGDREALETLLKELASGPLPINEVFACAGLGGRGKWEDATIESQLRVLDVNFAARMQIAHYFLNDMKRRGHGRILLVSSSSAFQPLPVMGAYAALNSALLSLGLSWGWEARSTGVRVLTICPGGMATNFQQANGVKTLASEKLMDPMLVAERALQALNGNNNLAIISFRSHAMYWMSKLIPLRLSVAFWGRAMERLR